MFGQWKVTSYPEAGRGNPAYMRRAGAGARMPGLLLPFRQGRRCSWPEYSSLRNAWAFSFRCAGIENAGEVGMWAKKKAEDYSPDFGLIKFFN